MANNNDFGVPRIEIRGWRTGHAEHRLSGPSNAQFNDQNVGNS